MVGCTNRIWLNHNIIEEDVLTRVLELDQIGSGGGTAVCLLFYWGLYPKLPEKPLIPEYIYKWLSN